MTEFMAFLNRQFEAGGFSTEDTLASFLPLVREVIDAHDADQVAPLEGLEALRVDGTRIWFEEAKRLAPRNQLNTVRQIDRLSPGAVEIVEEIRHAKEVSSSDSELVDVRIGERGQVIERPVYLTGYVSWEHEVEHHDPLTDIFGLGLLLATLACSLDLNNPDDLRKFVSHRRNLFSLNPDLHPVIAQTIFRLTELHRHLRAQDLRATLNVLENYREQSVEFQFDLASFEESSGETRQDKQYVVLSKLRERLFELSRRNRLLHFRPTMQTVNLTHASIPLSFNIENIRAEQVLVWDESLQKKLASGKPISLNKFLNFAEALYLPSVLNRILAETRRDQNEYGFAQLRLVACFLRWSDLKHSPPEAYDSPLVLLPVQLKKKKGIRDTYTLEVLSSEAEINPVVRHQFKQLYDIQLPETIDLAEAPLDSLLKVLESKVRESEPGVMITKIDRPQIDLIHEKARRKLDQYRRSARISGRGVRSHSDLDYSYDPANYHPLGIKLFQARVRAPETELRSIIEARPRPRTFATPLTDANTSERERTVYALREGGEENPYRWSFDLCSVTLANFRYRKMSLVRDYEALLANKPDNPAFDATFSLAPRPIEDETAEQPQLADRYDVVLCDPTQATAIARTWTGASYIIQGPPGTGKSQTITNLIGELVARDLRVLFVCEKRAAIDVVYARLCQAGLGELCCLIHDSQTDKKEFVMNLKRTYESFLDDKQKSRKTPNRAAQIEKIERELRPIVDFDRWMNADSPAAGISLRSLLECCIGLQDDLPELTEREQERLPDYAEWVNSGERLERYLECLATIQSDRILSRHPLRLLSTDVHQLSHPLNAVSGALDRTLPLIEEAIQVFSESQLSEECWHRIHDARRLVEYCHTILPLVERGQIGLLDTQREHSQAFTRDVEELRRRALAVTQSQESTQAWKHKIPPEELPFARRQAEAFESDRFAWLKPSWWRLRKALNNSYYFRSHVIRPSWSQILTSLADEYHAVDFHAQAERVTAEKFGFETSETDVSTSIERVMQLREDARNWPPWLQAFQARQLENANVAETVERFAQLQTMFAAIDQHLAPLLDAGFREQSLPEFLAELQGIQQAMSELPDYVICLAALAKLPPILRQVLRDSPLPPCALEAAMADATLRKEYRKNRAFDRFSGADRRRHVERLAKLFPAWQAANAREIREQVASRFREHVQIANMATAKLPSDRREFKRQFNRGRRELEHEFGKTMRYKSIRDLLSGDSGDVIKDLKPIWLMSPLSVSDTLPLSGDDIDVVIFDEASQITLEESIPSLFRAQQAIVVGDEMQLPPTNFFAARREDDDELLVEENGEVYGYDLDSNSFLNHAARNLPSTMLGWHYRSRSESLISFSNWAFYDGRLLTVPEEVLPSAERCALDVPAADAAVVNTPHLLERPVSFHLMERGIYEKRRNRAEAEYIAHLVRELLRQPQKRSIGIVAFSEAQQTEIEKSLEALADEDRPFRNALEAEREREEDGQFVGLLVKNLENIQGDERDIVILSICYGRPRKGNMRMNFGPINRSGGEKRLNVAFTRAKLHMAVISSITDGDITNDYNEGASCLKNYLRYAAAVSTGNSSVAQVILRGMAFREEMRHSEKPEATAFERSVSRALEQRGYLVHRKVGQSHFQCDLAIMRPGELSYRLGILLDESAYYSQPDPLERDLMRPGLLRNFGWQITQLHAKDWYQDPVAELTRIEQLAESSRDA